MKLSSIKRAFEMMEAIQTAVDARSPWVNAEQQRWYTEQIIRLATCEEITDYLADMPKDQSF